MPLRDASDCGRDDAIDFLDFIGQDGVEAKEVLANLRKYNSSPSDALVNAMGRRWVLHAAGAPDYSNDSWDDFGLPWIEKYDRAYLRVIESRLVDDEAQAAMTPSGHV